MEARDQISIDTKGQPDEGVHLHVTIRMLFSARKYEEACSILTSIAERIKVKEACLACRLYQEVAGERTLLFEVIWADENSFQLYLRSKEYRCVLLVVEMASISPEIRFDRITHSEGIGTIQDIRKWSGNLPENLKESFIL